MKDDVIGLFIKVLGFDPRTQNDNDAPASHSPRLVDAYGLGVSLQRKLSQYPGRDGWVVNNIQEVARAGAHQASLVIRRPKTDQERGDARFQPRNQNHWVICGRVTLIVNNDGSVTLKGTSAETYRSAEDLLNSYNKSLAQKLHRLATAT